MHTVLAFTWFDIIFSLLPFDLFAFGHMRETRTFSLGHRRTGKDMRWNRGRFQTRQWFTRCRQSLAAYSNEQDIFGVDSTHTKIPGSQ